MRIALCAAALLLLFATLAARAADTQTECVILLHGLTKDSTSLQPLQRQLIDAGFYVANIDYPSRQLPIAELAPLAINAGLEKCLRVNAHPINFVTHSLGGILVRFFYEYRSADNVHRVVMLAPPNHGSRIGDLLDHIPIIKDINGPAGRQLGTGVNSVPLQLGPLRFDAGIIAGNHSLNPLASVLLPGEDDGRISVKSAQAEAMCAFLVLPQTHGGIAADREVIRQAVTYLRWGFFTGEAAQQFDCAADG
ncbi:esterase/lipase family protein [Microbulbifer hainanensis]|uniref:esterase/lipase family protein n=1 Tax=Microbulbifer hainanensis TaxID=2735675 RepID=UPI001866F136|nr:alpha/beta hydrolase [Microbulbifer hainanensis]